MQSTANNNNLHTTTLYTKLDTKLQYYYLQQVIQVIVNSCQLSLVTVLAEWSAQLGKEATTFKRILADLREGDRGWEGEMNERGSCGEGERKKRERETIKQELSCQDLTA